MLDLMRFCGMARLAVSQYQHECGTCFKDVARKTCPSSEVWIGQGIDTDRALAKAMRDATGIPCSTTTLATCEALYLFKVQRIGVAVPYTEILMRKVQDFWKIAATVGMSRQQID